MKVLRGSRGVGLYLYNKNKNPTVLILFESKGVTGLIMFHHPEVICFNFKNICAASEDPLTQEG